MTRANDGGRIVVAAGMRRGGSTLQYQLIMDVLHAGGTQPRSSYVRCLADADLPAHSGDLQVIKTHKVPVCAPSLLTAPHVTVFYSSRDPRDSLVSFLRKYGWSYSDDRAFAFLREIEAEFRFWRGLPAHHWSTYESLTGDLECEIRRIAKVLAIPLDDATTRAIAQDRSLGKQRERISKVNWGESGETLGVDLIDKESMLHSNHIYLGESEGWRRELKRLDLAAIESSFSGFIVDAGYRLDASRVERAVSGVMRRARPLSRRVMRVLKWPAARRRAP